MTRRTTRNKLRWQGQSAHEDLVKAQEHLVQLAAMANGRSDYIDRHVAELIAAMEMLVGAVDKFNEGL